MTLPLQWGIIGTGRIAETFARSLNQTDSGELAAVGSRSLDSAARLGKAWDVRSYGSYQELVNDPDVEAVYISTPHPYHAQWAIRAAEAGKHVLCEKPAGLNHPEAMAMVDAAHQAGVFFMEAFMYRCHPQTAMLVELIRSGRIGEVRLVEASFGFHARFDPASRAFDPHLGGGGILDVGCYPVSLARLVAGAAQGLPFADPIKVSGHAAMESTGVDGWATAILEFENGLLGQIATGVLLSLKNQARIHGTQGSIELTNPWTADRHRGGQETIRVCQKGEDDELISVQSDRTAFAHEADVVAQAVCSGALEATAMSWADTLGNMRTLDQWRAAVGLEYPHEQPQHMTRPVHGRALKPGRTSVMRFGQINGLDKPVSRLVMGMDNQPSFAHVAVMNDAYAEWGGNTFDTAYIYGKGKQERLLGQWIESRGVRDELVVIGKGASLGACDPERLTRQLDESLDRLGLDYLDIYLMHRDNTAVPVGEFVDVLNEHHQAGRIKVFGGSNWTRERLSEANHYACSKGLEPMRVLSNNFSLARMIEPVWEDCRSCTGPEWRRWLVENGVANLAWSSQARGFFTPRADVPSDQQPDKSLVRCWYSKDNFERRARAKELAKRKGVQPINIAAAYVLAQPFNSFCLIGPRNLEELRSSLPALEVELTEEEVRWLGAGEY